MQRNTSQVPNIGSLGKVVHDGLNKEFVKIGEPNLDSRIQLGVRRLPFTKKTYGRFKKYMEAKGEQPTIKFSDSSNTIPFYYQIEILDDVNFTKNLNEDQKLLDYLKLDSKIKVLHEFKCVLDKELDASLKNLNQLFLVEESGLLKLKSSDLKKIDMNQINIFDFDVATICWNENVYGQVEVGLISVEGSCPKNTEKKARKLETKTLLKL